MDKRNIPRWINTICLALFAGVLLAGCAALPASQPASPLAAPAEAGAQPATGPQFAQPQERPQGCSSLDPEESVVLRIADQKTGQPQLAAFDLQAGQPLCSRSPINLPPISSLYISQDGKWVLFYENTETGYKGTFSLVDVAAWKVLPTQVDVWDWAYSLAFSPQGDRLALAFRSSKYAPSGDPQAYEIAFIDISSGSEIGRQEVAFNPRLLFFTPAGDRLVAYGGPEIQGAGADEVHAQAASLRAADASLDWALELPYVLEGDITNLEPEDGSDFPQISMFRAGAALSPNGQTLYIVHPNVDRLTTLDLASRKAVTVDIRRQTSWIEWLLSLDASPALAKVANGTHLQAVISADGKRLYVVGVTEKTESQDGKNFEHSLDYLGLRMIDVQTGELIDQVETQGSLLAISPGGRYLLLDYWDEQPHTEIRDTATLEVVRRFDGRQAAAVQRLDGEVVFLAANLEQGDKTLTLLDGSRLEDRQSWLWEDKALDWGFVPWPGTR